MSSSLRSVLSCTLARVPGQLEGLFCTASGIDN
jgi:hypothetical protein